MSLCQDLTNSESLLLSQLHSDSCWHLCWIHCQGKINVKFLHTFHTQDCSAIFCEVSRQEQWQCHGLCRDGGLWWLWLCLPQVEELGLWASNEDASKFQRLCWSKQLLPFRWGQHEDVAQVESLGAHTVVIKSNWLFSFLGIFRTQTSSSAFSTTLFTTKSSSSLHGIYLSIETKNEN